MVDISQHDTQSVDAEKLSRQVIDYWRAFESIPKADMGEGERRERINGFIVPALSDISASRSMYRDQNYAPAVYHLQQATEKMSKAFLLRSGLMSAKEVVGMSHDSLKGWIRLLGKASDVVAVFARNNPKVNTDLRDINDLDRNKATIAKLGYLDIVNLLRIYDNFARQCLSRLERELPGLLRSPEFPEMVRRAVSGIYPLERCEEADVLSKLREYERDPERLLLDNKVKLDIGQLYIVSSVLYPHESFARYSHSDKGELELKPTDYTMDLGIVRALPDILPRVEAIYHDISVLLRD